MLIAQGILIAEASSVPEIVVQPDVKLWVIFVFVAFCIVAGLVSKFLTMKHEQTLKLGEARKGHESNGADVTESSSGPPWWYVLLTICAALVSGFFILMLYGGSDHLGQRATIFIFVAFCVVAGLISKHMRMKHEVVLKQAELGNFPAAKPKVEAKANAGWSVGWFFLSFAILVGVAMLSLTWLRLDRPNIVSGEAAVGIVNVVSEPHPTVLPTSIRNWTEVPFEADRYCGIEACAAPLARMIAREIEADQISNTETEGTDVKVEAAPAVQTTVFILNDGMSGSWWYGANFGDFLSAFKKAIKSEMPSVAFHAQVDSRNYHLSFSFEELQNFTEAYPDGTLALKSGKVVCRSAELSGKTLSVPFLQKPWLTHFKDFTRQYPNSIFHVGGSTRVQPLRSKAHDRAVQDVANRLNLTAEQIEPHIVDIFTQAIERPYGKVFREAILVHNPPKVRARARNIDMASSSSWPWLRFDLFRPSFEFLLALIVCLTIVAGFISNIATQGYYRTEISNSLMLVAGVFVSVILLTVVLGVIV